MQASMREMLFWKNWNNIIQSICNADAICMILFDFQLNNLASDG